MTKPNKWFRRAFLGGVALSVMATGAQADELSALKAQLEALQSRVNQIETAPAAGTTPSGLPQPDSWISFHRGSDIGWDQSEHARPQEYIPEEQGFTIAITPTADLPAPVHQVTVSGYIKGDLIYDVDENLGDVFAVSAADGQGAEHVRLHARQSRFRIKSKSDTAVGQVRTLIEGDFFGGGGNELFSNSNTFRLRHAWGEWDITPNTTIGVGQTWSNFMNLFALPDTIDFQGPVGAPFKRQAQVRVSYYSGPFLFAVAVENPETDVTAAEEVDGDLLGGLDEPLIGKNIVCRESTGDNLCDVNDDLPDVSARLQYEAPGGHKFQLSGVLRHLNQDGDVSGAFPFLTEEFDAQGSDSAFGYGVLGAAAINLGQTATFTAIAAYGDGIGNYLTGGGGNDALLVGEQTGTGCEPPAGEGCKAAIYLEGDLKTIEAYSLVAALSLAVTDHTTANLVFGHYDVAGGDIVTGMVDEVTTIHANIIWQPVSRFRMGVEGMWGEVEKKGADKEDALRFQFGAWFFF